VKINVAETVHDLGEYMQLCSLFYIFLLIR